MNHVYRLKRSGRTQQLQPVPETARAAGKGSRTGKTLAQTVTATLASVALGGMASLAHAQQAPTVNNPPAVNQLPQGGVVTRGSVHINTGTTAAGNALMSVNQSSQRAVIDWASFNVGSQAKVQFNQPSSSAVVLNNILGNNASQIYGQISANGQVFLSNPNGVYFSPTAQVNVGGLVATTGKANADEFMAGKASFNRAGSTGSVVNEGQLTSAAGGYIALLAPEVRNQGVVIAQAGTVALASGEAITLNFNNAGTGLAGITTTPQAIAALVENRSAVLAEGGQIILSAHALASLQGSVVKNSGQLSATSLTEKGGKIVLMADSIALTATSRIEANGPKGGGTVLVGGDWQGQGDMRQAVQVTMAQGASIEANATDQGDGGTVVLWSDVHHTQGVTQVDGRIEAKAAGNGNGGRVETSGNALNVGEQLSVSTQATGSGAAGQWLLDPANITISSAANSGQAYSGGTFSPSSGADTSVINTATLQSALDATNITITTTNTGSAGASTGTITIASTLTWTSANQLTLVASGGLTGSAGIVTGATGSNLTINQAGNSTYSGVISGSGSVTKLGAGALTLSGVNTYTGGTHFNGGRLIVTSGGAIGTSGTLSFGGGTMVTSSTDYSGRFSTANNQAYAVDTGAQSVTWSTSLTSVGGSLTKLGTGRLTLGGANSLSGGITVQQGSLFLDNAAGLGTGSVVVNTGGAIDLNGKTVTSANPLSLSGTGTDTSGALLNTGTTTASFNGLISLAGHTTIGTTADGGGLSLSHTGAITGSGFNLTINGIWFSSTITLAGSLSTGSGELIKAGFSKLVLSGTNNYSGGTTLSAGVLSISDDRNLGAVPATPTVNLTLAGTLLFEGQPTALVLSSNRSIVLTGNTTLRNTSSTATATIANAITGSANLTISGSGTVLKVGSATAFASGAITVDTGSTLDLNGQTLTSTGVLSLRGTGVNNSGALMNSGAAATYAGLVSLAGNSSIIGGTGAINLSHTGIITGGTRALTLGGAAGGSISSIIGTTTGTLTKQDAGTWTLSGANTYTGATTVSAGVLKAGNANAFGPTSGAGAITVSSGAALDLNGQAVTSTGTLNLNGTGINNGGALMNSGAAASYAGLLALGSDSSIIGGSGSIALGNAGTINGSGRALTLGGAQGGSIAGIINTGAGTLTKQDAGTWALTGVNSFTGMVTVNAGTLQIATDRGLGAVPVTAAVKLTLNGGTLASNNTIDVTLNANRLIAIGINGGSIVNAGTSASTLSLEGAIGGGTVSSLTQGPLTITGGDIRIGANISMGAYDLLVKSTGNIFQGVATTNPTPANVVVSTQGAGHVTYWADSDASGAGAIQFRAGTSNTVRSSITTAGGNIVLGGGSGATAADGWARGLYAVNLGSYSHLDAGTGSITLKGMTNATTWGGTGVLIDSNSTLNASTIRITGNGNPTNTFSDFGVFLKGGTSVTASSLVNITGNGGGTASSAALANTGVRFDDVTVSATGSGNVVITGDGGGNAAGGTSYGIQLLGNSAGNRSSIVADTGTVTITGIEGAGAGGFGISATVARIGAASQTGLITVRANSLLTGFLSTAANNSQVLSSGVVNMEPLLGSASFVGRGLDLTYMQFGNSISSLTLGKVGNTGAVTFGTLNTNGNTITGPIMAYGDIGLVNDTASSTGVTLNGSVLQTAGRLSTPSLLLTGTGASNVSLAFSSTYGNVIGTVAGSGLGTVNINNGGTLSTVAAGALTVGTVGSTHGLSASGPVTVTTYRGDITLADNIVTSNAGTAAITLNAGQYMPVGDTTSGNLIFNNGVSLTTGSGGRALLYTGAVANAGLTALVGSGSGRFRYGSTSSINNFTNWLRTSGLYAIYRERPSASWSSTASQTFNYGNTPVIDTTGSVSGLVNGDTADTSMTVRLASTNAVTSTNARGFYNVGSYIFSRIEGAKALGYQVSNPTMTVNRATLTVTANDFTKTYDGVKFSGGKGVTYSGFATGETAVNALSGSVSYGGTAQNVVDASGSTYSIIPSGLSASNYTINYVNGALTVNPATLTVRINNDARFVADSETAGYNGASYSGFVAKQSESVLGGALTISRSSSGPDGNLAGANTQPGTYTGVLTGSGLTSTNYTINYVPGNYTIVPADQLLVKMANVSATYGSDPAYSLTSARYYRSSNSTIYDLTSSVVLAGSSFTLNDGAGGNTVFTLGATTPALSTGGQLNVGAYQVGAASITNTSINYSNTITVTGALQVNPKSVTAAVSSSVSKVYDGTPAMNGLTLGLTGAVTGDAVSASGSGAYASKNAGNPVAYTVSNITLTGADARNYVLTDSVTTLANNTLSGSNGVITAVPLSITANNDSKVYDGNAYSGGNGVVYSGFVNNETEADLVGTLAYGGTSQGATNVGSTYTIIPSGYGGTNYTIGYTNGTLSITPVVLSVTPISGALQGTVSKGYDGNNTATLNAGNYLLTGWTAGEGATVTKTTGTYDNANAGGGKTVTVTLVDADYTANSGTTLSNYTLPTSISGAVGVITAKPVTVTNTARTTTYDGASTYGVLASGASFTTSALVGADSVASVTQTPSGAVVTVSGIAQAGNFTVTPSNALLGVGNANNYSFSYVNSTHTVSPAVLSVIPITGALQGTVSKGYDGNNTATLNAGNYLLTGWTAGEGATVTKTTGTYDNANAGGGKTVTVTLVDADYTANSGTTLSNYTLPTSISGAVGSISKAALTATGNSASVTYNGANQSVSGFTVSGLQGSDTVDSLSSVTASGAIGKNAGSYNNTVTAGLETNYTVTPVNGSLAIAKAALTATGNSLSVTYNGANQSVSGFTVSGLQGSDSAGSLSNVVALGATGKNAGSYTNSVTAGTETNYTVTPVNGSLAIAKANATVTASSSTLTYSGADQTVGGFTATGLVGGEMASVLTGVTASRTEKNAGTFAIAASGADVNYNLTFVDGSMLINKVPLAVRVNDDAKFVTQSDAAGYRGVSYSGFVGGEADSVLGGNLVISRSASGPDGNTSAANSAVGSYTGALTASGLTSPNYTLSYQSGSYRIIPADQLLIKLANATTTYGQAAIYSVSEAKYLNQSNTIVDLTGSVTSTVTNGTTRFAVSDGVGGSASFAVSANGAVLSGAGQLSAGAYQLDATGVSVSSNNFSNNLAVVGALEVNTVPVTPALAPTKVYDATTSFAGQNLGVAGAQAGDVVSATGAATFASKNAGTGIGYSVANLALTGTDARNYYLTGMGTGNSVTGANGTITPAPLTVSFSATDKVYDGNTRAGVMPTDNRFAGDVLSVSATGSFADKNVGSAKPVNVAAVVLSGADAANYTVNPTASTTASITRLAAVTWVGGPTGRWFDPANWAGGAVPDLANVANVTIPAGVTVSFDNTPVAPAQAGPVSIDSLGAAGNLDQSAGTLNVGAGGVTLKTLTQTGGEMATTGALTLGSLSQSAGSLSAGSLSTTTAYSQAGTGTINVAGDVSITASAAPVLLGNLNAGGTLIVYSTGGSITQTASTALTVAGASTLAASLNNAPSDVVLGNEGNTLTGLVTATGDDVTINTTGPLSTKVAATGNATLTSGGTTTLGASTVGGNLNVTSTGHVTQTAPLTVKGTTTVTSTEGDVVLSHSNNNLTGVVTTQGNNVTVNTYAPQTTVVSATEDATLSTPATLNASGTAGSLTTQSGSTTTLGTTTVKGDLKITTNNADIVQTGSVLVSGTTDLNAGTAKVTLTDPGNGFAGPVTVVGTGTVMRTEGMKDDPSVLKRPVVLTPALAQNAAAYQVTLLKLPQDNEAGVVHIELRDGLEAADVELPAKVQVWMDAAGGELSLVGAVGVVELPPSRRAIRLLPSAERQFPLQFALQTGQQRLFFRIVKRP